MAIKLAFAITLAVVAACQPAPPVRPTPVPDAMIIADVRFSIRPDAESAFAAAIGPFLTQSREVSGNLDFQVLRTEGEPLRIVLLERWDSMASFEAYLGSPAFAAFRSDVGPLLAGPPESAYYRAEPAEREVVR